MKKIFSLVMIAIGGVLVGGGFVETIHKKAKPVHTDTSYVIVIDTINLMDQSNQPGFNSAPDTCYMRDTIYVFPDKGQRG